MTNETNNEIQVGGAVEVVGPAIGVARGTQGRVISVVGETAKIRVVSRYSTGVAHIPVSSLKVIAKCRIEVGQ